MAEFFQYPRTDRTLCNGTTTPGNKLDVLPFSILERIELSATWKKKAGQLRMCDFQYPRTDRTLCNPRTPMQLLVDYSDFQYPRTDRTLCNRPRLKRLAMAHRLSVSSNGSNSLQQLARTAAAVEAWLSVSSNGSNSLQQ